MTGWYGKPYCRAAVAGLAYGAVTFALAIVLGTVRVYLLDSWIGEIAAVVAELSVILPVAWVLCGWLVARFAVAAGIRVRLIMGAVALSALFLLELGLSLAVFDRTASEFLATYGTDSAWLGLMGQIAFAAFPIVHRSRGAR